jgi:hypothetical protein
MWVFPPVHFFLRNASNRIGSTAWSKLPGQFREQIQMGVAHESNRSLLIERGLEAASSPFAFSIAVAEIYFLSSFILSTASDTLSLAF